MKYYILILSFITSANLCGQTSHGRNVDIDSLRKAWRNQYAQSLKDSSKSILQIIPCDNYFTNLKSDESDLMYTHYKFINSKNDTIKKTADIGEITIILPPGKYKVIMESFNTYYFQDTIELPKSKFTKINIVFDLSFNKIINKITSIVNYDIIDFDEFSRTQSLEKSILIKH